MANLLLTRRLRIGEESPCLKTIEHKKAGLRAIGLTSAVEGPQPAVFNFTEEDPAPSTLTWREKAYVIESQINVPGTPHTLTSDTGNSPASMQQLLRFIPSINVIGGKRFAQCYCHSIVSSKLSTFFLLLAAVFFLLFLPIPSHAVGIENQHRHFVIVVRNTTLMKHMQYDEKIPKYLTQLLFDKLQSNLSIAQPGPGDTLTILFATIGLDYSKRKTPEVDLCPQHRDINGTPDKKDRPVSLETLFFLNRTGVIKELTNTSPVATMKEKVEAMLKEIVNNPCTFAGDTFWPLIIAPAAIEFLSNPDRTEIRNRASGNSELLPLFILVVVDGRGFYDQLNKAQDYLLDNLLKIAQKAEDDFHIRYLGTYDHNHTDISVKDMTNSLDPGLRYRVFKANRFVSEGDYLRRLTEEGQKLELRYDDSKTSLQKEINKLKDENNKLSKLTDEQRFQIKELTGIDENVQYLQKKMQELQSSRVLWIIATLLLAVVFISFIVATMKRRIRALEKAHIEEIKKKETTHRKALRRLQDALALNRLSIPE